MRTNIGISFSQTGTASLQQTGNYTITLNGTGSVTLTLPATSGTLATVSGTESLSNKTLISAALTTPTIGSAGATFTGSVSGSTILRASGTASGTVIIPAGNDTLVNLTGVQTLSNKTFVAPSIGAATATSVNGLQIVAVSKSFECGSNLIFGTHDLEFVTSGAATLTLPSGIATLYSTATGSITSAQLRGSLTDETGTGSAVFATGPTLVNPILGVASATSLNVSTDVMCDTLSVTSISVDDITATGAITGTGYITGLLKPAIFTYGADGAIATQSAIHQITKSSAAAMTVAAPSSQDGELLMISSGSNFAHVVTFTGSTLADGTTGLNSTVTFAAFAGASVTVYARGSL